MGKSMNSKKTCTLKLLQISKIGLTSLNIKKKLFLQTFEEFQRFFKILHPYLFFEKSKHFCLFVM